MMHPRITLICVPEDKTKPDAYRFVYSVIWPLAKSPSYAKCRKLKVVAIISHNKAFFSVCRLCENIIFTYQKKHTTRNRHFLHNYVFFSISLSLSTHFDFNFDPMQMREGSFDCLRFDSLCN